MLSRLQSSIVRPMVASAIARTSVASLATSAIRQVSAVRRFASTSAPSTYSTPSGTSAPASTLPGLLSPRLSIPVVSRDGSLVLSLSGPDRSGIVNDVTSALALAGANVEESRMSILGQDFAMIVRVTVPPTLLPAQVKTLLEGLLGGEFLIGVRPTGSSAPLFTGPVRIFSVAVEGPDQPGIVQVLAQLFVDHKGSVRDLDTDTGNAPFAGYKILNMKAVVALPVTSDFEAFESSLHKFEDEYGFDVDVNEGMNNEQENEVDNDKDDDEAIDMAEEEPEEPADSDSMRRARAVVQRGMAREDRNERNAPAGRGPPSRGPPPPPASSMANRPRPPTGAPAPQQRGPPMPPQRPAAPQPPRGPPRR